MDRVDYLPLYAGGANSQLPATERIWEAVLCQELLQGLPFELEDQVTAISPEKCLSLPDDGRHVKCNDLSLSLSRQRSLSGFLSLVCQRFLAV